MYTHAQNQSENAQNATNAKNAKTCEKAKGDGSSHPGRRCGQPTEAGMLQPAMSKMRGLQLRL